MSAIHFNQTGEGLGMYSPESDDDELSQTNTDQENESEQGEECEHEEVEEEEDEVMSEDDTPSVWLKVIGHLALHEKEGMKDSEGNIEIEKVAELVKMVVERHLTTADEIREDDVFSKIDATKDRLMEEGYESDEATDAAWDSRKFLVEREIINPHLEMLLSESDEDEDEEEEEMEVTPSYHNPFQLGVTEEVE